MSPSVEVPVNEFLDALDHPVFFLFVISIGVACVLAILTWAAKAANLPGPASLFQTP